MELKRSLTVKRGFEHLNCDITSRTRRDVVCYKRLCSRLGEMRPSYDVLMLLFVPYTRIFLLLLLLFFGKRDKHSCSASAIINLPLGSIVDSLLSTLHASTNRIFLGSGYAISLSFFFSGCHPRFSRLAAWPLNARARVHSPY